MESDCALHKAASAKNSRSKIAVLPEAGRFFPGFWGLSGLYFPQGLENKLAPEVTAAPQTLT